MKPKCHRCGWGLEPIAYPTPEKDGWCYRCEDSVPCTRTEPEAVLTIRGPREQVEIINDFLNPDSYKGVTSRLTVGKSEEAL